MKFQDIFNETGWYVADSFHEGVVIFIESGPNGNELKFMCFGTDSAMFPSQLQITLYKGLFDKEYVKVFNRQSLFGEKRKNLFKPVSA